LHRCIHSNRYHLQIGRMCFWGCAEQTEGDLKILSVHDSSHPFVYQFVPLFGRSVHSSQHTVHSWFLIRCGCIFSHSSPVFFLNTEIRPLVELSWSFPAPLVSSSFWIFTASFLPSSTPHWSKLLMFHTAPSVKTLCS